MNRALRRRDAARERANSKVRALISVGRLVAMATETQAEVDERQARIMPPNVSCKEGCAACCYLPIFLEVAEAHAIVQRHRDIVIEVLPELIEHDRRLDEAIPRQYFADLPDPDRGDAANRHIAGTYTDLRLRCPFLGADDRCRVYDARPIPCRTHFAVGDPKDCVDGHAEQKFWATPERLGAPARLMEKVARAQNGTVQVGLLQSMVLTALHRQAGK